MRAVLIAVVTLVTLPALAQSSGGTEVLPPPPSVQQSRTETTAAASGTSVVMEREALMQQLALINEKLAVATGRAKKDKAMLKLLEEARAQLKEVGRQVSNAPLAPRVETPRPAPQQPPPPPLPTVQPITEAVLRSLASAIRNEPFAEDQLTVLGEAVSTQYFLVSQTQQMLRLFSFSKDRLKAMRLLRPRVLDMENSYKLYESFEFSSDKEELKRILAAQ
jgi:hypothetical protein